MIVAVWFTMFALACFQSFGRTQDGQHRVFIEHGWREGGGKTSPRTSRPPRDVQSWLDRLERGAAPEQFDQGFLPWRRTFVDLYTVARWLDEYVEVVRKLPRIVQDRGPISLNDPPAELLASRHAARFGCRPAQSFPSGSA